MSAPTNPRERILAPRAIVALCAASALVTFAVAVLGPRMLDRGGRTKFAVVDLAAVVRKQQEASVSLLADGTADQRARNAAMLSAQEFGKRLDREVVELSKDCGCVLLMREAVVSGQLDDVTPVLLTRLTNKR
jgi:hypothetical protein